MVIGFGVAPEMLQLVGDVTVSLQLIVAATTVCSPTTYNPHGMWILRFLSREPLLLQIPSSRSRSTKRSLVNITIYTREVMMGEGNGVASVTLFTFTVGPGPHAHN